MLRTCLIIWGAARWSVWFRLTFSILLQSHLSKIFSSLFR